MAAKRARTAAGAAGGLTEEQQAVVALARPPQGGGSDYEEPEPPRAAMVVRVTAGPGSGKTHTLLEYAKTSHQRGNTVVLVTFTRAAAAEAAARLGASSGGGIKCVTLHSLALKLAFGQTDEFDIKEDHVYAKWIADTLSQEVAEFVSRVPDAGQRKAATSRVLNFIKKGLDTFLHSDKSEAQGLSNSNMNIYYPCLRAHQGDASVAKLPDALLAPGRIPLGDVVAFYIASFKKLWSLMFPQDGSNAFVTYSSLLKIAQLQELPMPGSVVVVDELQDLNPCQLRWVCDQAIKYGKDLVLAGDLMQAIYSFQGAKPTLVYSSHFLRPDDANLDIVDLGLTKSFRFGPHIASVSNSIIFAKSKSPLASLGGGFCDYVIKGEGPADGFVTAERITVERIRRKHRTTPGYSFAILASSNLSSFEKCIELLGPAPHDVRIYINGRGRGSGAGIFLEVGSKLMQMYKVFANQSNRLAFYPWDDDATTVNWAKVKTDVEELEVTNLQTIVNMIEMYEDQIPELWARFNELVLKANVKQEIKACNADVTVSTIHSAKGMEWDVVEVLEESMMLLNKVKVSSAASSPSRSVFVSASAIVSQGHAMTATFDYKHYGDDLHKWFVACSRAKRELCLPPELLALFRDLAKVEERAKQLLRPPADLGGQGDEDGDGDGDGDIHAEVQSQRVAASQAAVVEDCMLLGGERSDEDIHVIHEQLCLPLEAKLGGLLVVDGRSFFAAREG